MLQQVPTMQPDEQERSRNEARTNWKTGAAYLARAFNHCDSGELAYRYADHVQAQLFDLCVQIDRLLEYGAIESNPGHERYLMGKAAQNDAPLQSLISKAERAARGRTKRVSDQ